MALEISVIYANGLHLESGMKNADPMEILLTHGAPETLPISSILNTIL